jgi:hypothetical protein
VVVNRVITLVVEEMLQISLQAILSISFEKNEMGWACLTTGERRGVYMVLVGKPG